MNAAMRRAVLLQWRSRNRRDLKQHYGRERMIFCSDRAAVLRRSALYAKRFPGQSSRDAEYLIATAREYLAEARHWIEILRGQEPRHVLNGYPTGGA